jgi:hypothetical protein
LLGPGPSSFKKKYLPDRGVTKVGKHWFRPIAVVKQFQKMGKKCDREWK